MVSRVPASRLLFAGVALGLVTCAFVAALMPQPWRAIFFTVTGVLAVVPAFTGPAASAAGARPPASTEESGTQAQPPTTLTDLVTALPVGIIIIGGDGRIRAFNQAAAEIFDVPAERAQGRSLIEIVRSFELDRRLMATLREGVEETAELTYVAAQERRLQLQTRVLLDPASEREALAIITDLTRIRELEALRRDFVSNVSHELRTPLTAVKLMVETLQSGVDSTANEKFLTSIGLETERMIMLVEDLLDLARMETGKLELRLGTVDIGLLCREAVDRQLQRAHSLGINLECSVAGDAIIVSADRDKLYQVLVNLLDNALRHTPAGGRVTVSAAREHGGIHIVVQDTGSGIPSTALPHIFERFYVVDAARARMRSGTGLGLAIVRHIVETHGGSISVESELGVGTTFRCALRA